MPDVRALVAGAVGVNDHRLRWVIGSAAAGGGRVNACQHTQQALEGPGRLRHVGKFSGCYVRVGVCPVRLQVDALGRDSYFLLRRADLQRGVHANCRVDLHRNRRRVEGVKALRGNGDVIGSRGQIGQRVQARAVGGGTQNFIGFDVGYLHLCAGNTPPACIGDVTHQRSVKNLRVSGSAEGYNEEHNCQNLHGSIQF